MSSKLELLEQCIADLKAEKDELKGENAKLSQIIEENARRDVENAEHKVFQLRMLNLRLELQSWNKISDSHRMAEMIPEVIAKQSVSTVVILESVVVKFKQHSPVCKQ